MSTISQRFAPAPGAEPLKTVALRMRPRDEEAIDVILTYLVHEPAFTGAPTRNAAIRWALAFSSQFLLNETRKVQDAQPTP